MSVPTPRSSTATCAPAHQHSRNSFKQEDLEDPGHIPPNQAFGERERERVEIDAARTHWPDHLHLPSSLGVHHVPAGQQQELSPDRWDPEYNSFACAPFLHAKPAVLQ